LFKVPLATPNVIPSGARDLAHDPGSLDLACVIQNQAWDPSLRSGWHGDEQWLNKAGPQRVVGRCASPTCVENDRFFAFAV